VSWLLENFIWFAVFFVAVTVMHFVGKYLSKRTPWWVEFLWYVTLAGFFFTWARVVQ
jgi:hypothetical protein